MNVAVSPDRRRAGVASRMIRRLLEETGGGSDLPITLEVRVSNRDAIAMYEGLGFRSAGVRRRYYQDNGEDALIMWLATPRQRDVVRFSGPACMHSGPGWRDPRA